MRKWFLGISSSERRDQNVFVNFKAVSVSSFDFALSHVFRVMTSCLGRGKGRGADIGTDFSFRGRKSHS